jgi:hypothetical protein
MYWYLKIKSRIYHRLVNIRSGDRILSILSINEEHVSLFVVIVKTKFFYKRSTTILAILTF